VSLHDTLRSPAPDVGPLALDAAEALELLARRRDEAATAILRGDTAPAVDSAIAHLRVREHLAQRDLSSLSVALEALPPEASEDAPAPLSWSRALRDGEVGAAELGEMVARLRTFAEGL
jgi:hypothetical protein